jgi:NTE family protein
MSKTALVLSGGAMFGAYHVGAWRALEADFRPDIIVGASVGSLNGWAISGGCTADHLASRWLDREAASLLRYRVFPVPSLFRSHILEQRAQQIFREFVPRTEMGVVVVEFPRFRSRLVTGADVTWRHLAASCSVPVGFPPVRIGVRSYVDGGLLTTLPVWAAVEMGADFIVAVNALPIVPSRIVRAAARRVALFANERPTPVSGAEVLTITPGESLGTMGEAIHWNRDNVQRWIERGETDTRAAMKNQFPIATGTVPRT